jgi:hypothetical protein
MDIFMNGGDKTVVVLVLWLSDGCDGNVVVAVELSFASLADTKIFSLHSIHEMYFVCSTQNGHVVKNFVVQFQLSAFRGILYI